MKNISECEKCGQFDWIYGYDNYVCFECHIKYLNEKLNVKKFDPSTIYCEGTENFKNLTDNVKTIRNNVYV